MNMESNFWKIFGKQVPKEKLEKLPKYDKEQVEELIRDKQYYTPDTEDLFIGYVFQFYHGDHKEWQSYVLENDDELIPILKEILGGSLVIRTPYLTKEQIEAEGWESIGTNWFNLKEVSGELGYYLYVRLQIWGDENKSCRIIGYRWNPTKGEVPNEEQGVLFEGQIKSINELRKLMKWLNIKK